MCDGRHWHHITLYVVFLDNGMQGAKPLRALGLSVILLILFYSVFLREAAPPPVTYTRPAPLSNASGGTIEKFDINDLFDSGTSLSQLAESGQYTIVELYTVHCTTCKQLDREFPSFLKRRQDVAIKQVKLFSGSIFFASSEEMRAWNNRQDDIREMYRFFGTPHIEIYDPSGLPIARDYEGNKAGLKFLYEWLADREPTVRENLQIPPKRSATVARAEAGIEID